MVVLVLHDVLSNLGQVADLGLVLDLSENDWILGEDFLHQELPGQGESLYLGVCHMHKLRLGIVADVVVPKEAILRDEMSQLVSLALQWLLVEVETNPNRAI